MVSSDFRAEARSRLKGKWGKVASISLAYFAIVFVISFVESMLSDTLASVFSIAFTVINVPFSFGLIYAFFKVYHGEEVRAFDFIVLGLNNFGKAWSITLHIFLKLLVPIIITFVAYVFMMAGFIGLEGLHGYEISLTSTLDYTYAIVMLIGFVLVIVGTVWGFLKSFYYVLAQYVAMDNLSLSGKDAVNKSRELMTKKRWKYFCLSLSFIGWAFLVVLSFGIGYLWIAPYITLACIAFYKNTLENK